VIKLNKHVQVVIGSIGKRQNLWNSKQTMLSCTTV